VRITASVVLAVFLVVFLLVSPEINSAWLYGSFSYNNGEYNIFFRIFHYVMAFAVGIPVLVLVPRRTTFFASWGRNSLIIYLTHIAAVGIAEIVFKNIPVPIFLGYALCIVSSVLFCIFMDYLIDLFSKKQKASD
jgi:fucose 4-O-acetylase-like acetyltransferase